MTIFCVDTMSGNGWDRLINRDDRPAEPPQTVTAPSALQAIPTGAVTQQALEAQSSS